MQRLFAFAVALAIIALSVPPAWAQETPVYAPLAFAPPAAEQFDYGFLPPAEPAPEPAPEPEPTPPPLSILKAVLKGKELLAPVLADFKSKEPQVQPVASKKGLTAAALAIWDRKDDSVRVVGGTRGANYFTPDGGAPAIPIVTHAGSRTAFRDSDPDSVVVGTVQGDMVAITYKKKKLYAPRFAYYAPYNSELYSTETLAAGSDYLSFLIQDAFDELDALQVSSRSFPGQPLTAVIDPYLIKSIAVIEHADGQIYEEENPEEALGRFYVKLALNGEDALGTTVSSAGARGMVQFIPSTYKLMVTKRPDLKLIPDFVEGMADHNNAVKAEAAYLDMILADLPQEVRDKYLLDRGSAAPYIAAGYNGGSTRVKKAILAWGDKWASSHSKNSLRKETINYVVKLNRVYNMLATGFFATPAAPANALPSTGGLAANPPAAPESSVVTAANL